MFGLPTTNKINDLLENIGIVLDITEAQFETVKSRYDAVAKQLSKENSPLSVYQPEILPQGSFLLGTMIRPIMEDDELDVDLVCRLKGKKLHWSQRDLKIAVKDQLIHENENYRRMLDEEGNRCWTLVYKNDKFHLDILPSLVGDNNHINLSERAYNKLNAADVESISLRITDKREYNYHNETDPNFWPKSNPFGYAAWFKEQANLNSFRAVNLSESVTPLPSYKKKKEPLLRAIQILKRHRDIMFGCDEDRPISIIITTLAAKAYRKEDNVRDALLNILSNMQNHMQRKYSDKHGKEIWWVGNPVNERHENFADKWPGEKQKEDNFFQWLKKAQNDFAQVKDMDMTNAYRFLKNLLGSRAINEAVKNLGYESLISENYKPVNYSAELLSVPHRQRPIWPMILSNNCDIYGRYNDVTDSNKAKSITAQTIVPKDCSIYFTATTNVQKPYEVYWQVVNTGDEARNVGGLRGGIFQAQTLGKGGLVQKEHSGYSGLHWIECFIVKNGVCVARSSEFFVNIQ